MLIGVLSVLILCTFSAQNVFAQIGMGPLNINLVKATECPADDQVLKIDIIDIGDKQGFSFNSDLPFPIDDSISYAISVDKIQNGQIQKGVFKHGGDKACQDLKKFLGKFWLKLLDAMGAPDSCPIKEGSYKVDEFPFLEEDVDVKTFLYGRFLMNVEIIKDKSKKISCFTLEFTNSRPGESV